MLRSRLRPAVLAAGIALLASSAAALPAHADAIAADPTDAAAGFGAPLQVSPARQAVADVQTFIAPTGRTMVVWRTRSRHDVDGYSAVVGDNAGALGPAAALTNAAPLVQDGSEPQIAALTDGTFAICGVTYQRRATVIRCTFAPPGQGFGPLVTIDSAPSDAASRFTMTPRPTGGLVFVIGHDTTPERTTMSSMSVDNAGRVSPQHAFTTIGVDDGFNLASAADGTVGFATVEYIDVDYDNPALFLMAPGSDEFGVPVATGMPARIASPLHLEGGQSLRLNYERTGPGRNLTQVVARHADGSFTAPAYLPRPGSGFVFGQVVELGDGSPFAVSTAYTTAHDDCANVTSASIGAGPLASGASSPAAALSTKDQIPAPESAHASALADGTVIATWGDAFSDGSRQRIEVAVLPAGASAFKQAQVLNPSTSEGASLATGGDQAVLAWASGVAGSTSSHVMVSALRRAAPYAAQAARPKHPSTSCS